MDIFGLTDVTLSSSGVATAMRACEASLLGADNSTFVVV